MAAPLLKWLFDPEFRILKAMAVAHSLRRQGRIGRLIGGLIWKRYVTGAGCHISPDTPVGAGLQLPHPTGIVIGWDCTVGERVTIFQNVTLGRATGNRHGGPTLGNDVIIYAGAVIAGQVHIGDRAVIGANCVVMTDVPEGTIIRPAQVTADKTS